MFRNEALLLLYYLKTMKKSTDQEREQGEIPILSQEFYFYFKFAAIILVVVALGLVVVNQTFAYYYKVHFLKNPCHLCAELNQNQSKCVEGCFIFRKELYPTNSGEWKDPYSNLHFDVDLTNP